MTVRFRRLFCLAFCLALLLAALTVSDSRAQMTACEDGQTDCPAGYECQTQTIQGRKFSQCVKPGSRRCDFGEGYLIFCDPTDVCDAASRRCAEPVEPPPGNIACPDDLFHCPVGTECKTDLDPAGSRTVQCVAPGSQRCDLGNGRVAYCAADKACGGPHSSDCVERSKAPPGGFVCPDGITTCKDGMECKSDLNPANRMSTQCVAPGSQRCDLGDGRVAYCPADKACGGPHSGECVERSKAPPGSFVCPDGITTCRDGIECKSDLNPANQMSTQCAVPGAKRCEFGGGKVFYCDPNEVCSPDRGCAPRSTAPPGHFVCPDGVSVCSDGMECRTYLNPIGEPSTACVAPGSKECDVGGGKVYYCDPKEVCSPPEGCVARPTARPGNFVCPDGVFICPDGMECKTDMSPTNHLETQCVKPGSKRCNFGGGFVYYCEPGTTCDVENRGCKEVRSPASPPPPPPSSPPPPLPPGSLVGKPEILANKHEDHGSGSYTKTTYAATSSDWERMHAVDKWKVRIHWDYAGVPSSLMPGQTVVITVTGGMVEESPKDNPGSGSVLAGVVAIYGDVDVKTSQQADRGNPTGKYEFVVKPNAKHVEIHLGGWPAGAGTIWKYDP